MNQVSSAGAIPQADDKPTTTEPQPSDAGSGEVIPAQPPSISLLAEIVENSPVAILVCDADGAIMLLNREAEALFGYSRSTLLGCSIETLVPAGERGRHPAGLANRRHFDESLALEIERSQRQNLPLAAAMLDLDRFKLVNDRCGHAVGDAVLRQVAELIRQHCRRIDLASRYGGEEFAIALPASNAVAAGMLCERIRKAMVDFDWRSLHPNLASGVTLSAGVSELRPGMDADQLLSLADNWLYAAKRGGRNRVMPKLEMDQGGA